MKEHEAYKLRKEIQENTAKLRKNRYISGILTDIIEQDLKEILFTTNGSDSNNLINRDSELIDKNSIKEIIIKQLKSKLEPGFLTDIEELIEMEKSIKIQEERLNKYNELTSLYAEESKCLKRLIQIDESDYDKDYYHVVNRIDIAGGDVFYPKLTHIKKRIYEESIKIYKEGLELLKKK